MSKVLLITLSIPKEGPKQTFLDKNAFRIQICFILCNKQI